MVVISLMVVSIIAVLLLLLISIAKKYSSVFLISEGVVLVCLIALLVSTLISRKRIIEQDLERAKSPYGKVDKKEIDKIFDIIDKEEKRRGRSMVYAAPAPAPDKTEETSAAAENKTPTAEESTSSAAAEEEEDEDRLPIIFPDKDEYEGEKKAFSPISEERAAARREEREKAKEESQAEEAAAAEGNDSSVSDEIADLAAAAALGGVAGVIAQDAAGAEAEGAEPRTRGKNGKGGKNMENRPKKRQPVYYDQYGRPIAPPQRQAPQQPVGYDQYGRPIYAQRPPQKKPRPIGFDQNGRPIFAQPQRKPRTPVGYDQYGRPIYAPAPQGGRPRPAGARPPQGQRRRPVPGAEQAAAAAAPQPAAIPTEPMAASAADALAAIEANTSAAGAGTYYDEDYIPVVVHVEEDFNYSDDRYTPRVRAGVSTAGAVAGTVAAAAAVAAPVVTADEFNSRGSDVYRPDYASEDIPVVVPVFEDMEVDYSTSRGFTPMGDTYGQKSYAAPVYTPEPVRTEVPLATTPIYQDPTTANPEYNAKSKSDYVRDDDEERFVYVPHFDDDDPIPAAAPAEPAIPHWKLAKMKRRKVKRRSRRGMPFKLRSEKFSEYTQSIVG